MMIEKSNVNLAIIFAIIIASSMIVSAIPQDLTQYLIFNQGEGSYDISGLFNTTDYSISSWFEVSSWTNDENKSQTIAQQRTNVVNEFSYPIDSRGMMILGISDERENYPQGISKQICESLTDIHRSLGFSPGRNESGCDQWLFYHKELQEDKLYHVVATYDGNTAKIYINGDLVATRDLDVVKGGYDTEFAVGGKPADLVFWTGWQDFNGDITKFHVFDKALTSSEVKDLYDDEKPSTSSSSNHRRKSSSSSNLAIADYSAQAPVWQCSAWSECNDGIQTRVCTDLNNGYNKVGMPEESRFCSTNNVQTISQSLEKKTNNNWIYWLIGAAIVLVIILLILIFAMMG
ncbi:MAG: LamG domain-containing protein [Nanoarchaeota archaeon]|nr:LamG domain-containing protein [Nanoarchaeota archaeon]